MIIAKPDLVITSNTVATYMTTSLGDTKYGLHLNLQNIGIDATSGYNYTVYCADGSGNPGTSIYLGSFSDILLTGDTLDFTQYFYASTSCNPANGLIVEIAPSNSNCLCSLTSFVVPLTQGMDAVDDNFTTPEDTPLNANVSTNDTPAGAIVDTMPISNVTHGVLVLNNDGTFTYTPNPDYNGSDSFIYQVCDTGDPQQCDTATVYITVTPVNDPPIAIDDNFTTPEDTPLSESVALNDTDPDGGSLNYDTTPVTGVSNGTLTLNADGSFTYVPASNFVGGDHFTYRVCNSGTPSLCDTATVYITVTPVNDPPIAIDDNYTTPEDTPLSDNVTTNDTEVEDSLVVSTTPVIDVSHGSLTLNADGTFTYVPNLNYNGPDSFVYQVCDHGTPALCDTATVYITVTPVNDPPIAIDDNYSTPTNQPIVSENVTANDNDLDGDGLVVNTSPINGPTYGTLTLNTDGTFVYTPNTNFNGYDQFDYIVCDTGTPTLCDTATVYIKVGNLEVVFAPTDTLDCQTSTVTIDGSSSSDGVNFTYNWTTTSGNILSGQGTKVIVVDMPGDYRLTILDTVSNVSTYSIATVLMDTVKPTAMIVEPHDKLSCINNTVFLSGNGSDVGSNYAYQWSTSNGSLSGNTQALITDATQAGMYQLEVTDLTNGCTASATTVVDIDTLSPSISILAPTQEINCKTSCIQLEAAGTNPSNTNYTWSTVSGSIQSGQSTLQPTICAGGQYTITAENPANGCKASTSINIVENTTPPAVTTLSNQPISCSIQQVFIEADVTSGSGNYSYDWSPISAIVSGDTTSNPLVGQSGTYTVVVTDNGSGCTTTSSVTVNSSVDVPQLNLSAIDTLTCKDTLITVSALTDNSYSIEWHSDNGVINSDPTNVNILVSQPGLYTAVVTNPSTGCTATKTIEAFSDYTAPLADADDIQKQDCATTLVQIGNLDNANMNNVIFEWTTQDGHFVSANNLPNPIVDKIGTYRLKVIDMHTGCASEDDVSVSEVAPLTGANIVKSLPGCDGRTGALIVTDVIGSKAPFTYSFDGGQHFGNIPIGIGLNPGDYEVVIQDEMGCEYSETVNLPIPTEGDILVEPDTQIKLGDSTTIEVFTSTPLDAIDTIIWNPIQDLYCLDNCLKQTVKPMVTTVYNITLVDTLGCVAHTKTTVHVADPDVFIPNVFSPNGDGQNDYFTVLGNTERIEEVVTMQIYDRWGSHIFSKEHFSLNNYSEGWDGTYRGKKVEKGVFVYIIKLKYIDGRIIEFHGDINIVN
ncbi:MAG TPA: tandem-95 repeat protein [Saprospiraceae bacterium]|nr:tandem-95 repeat protein [Saprospiraceae bacterium]